ncbi:MAG: galactokinase [Terracidiphilus sp.]|jgi:D-glycero-alpha-D-manno-heptose-7-phosphate kinase
MIITRTPFRITLGGGGTDLPSFYREHGGFVLAVAIDKYMYMNVNTPIVDDMIRVRYSKAETVRHVDEIEHSLAREAMKFFKMTSGLEIVSIADIPAGTGMGSSSCYLIGLLKALHTLSQRQVSAQELAEEACYIELNRMEKPIGKQDQYMAAFGGLTRLDIDRQGTVDATRLELGSEILEELERNLLLFYTGQPRDATLILAAQDDATKRNERDVVTSLLEIKEIGYEICDCIQAGNLARFGKLMDLHWQVKKRLSKEITNPRIDAWYELAKQNGALGGKITGAGGGGFLTVYCEQSKVALRDAMRKAGLRELGYRFDFEGCKVVFDIVSRDGRLAHMHRLKNDGPSFSIVGAA